MELLHGLSGQFNVTDKSSNFFLRQLLAIMRGRTTTNDLAALVDVVGWVTVRGICCKTPALSWPRKGSSVSAMAEDRGNEMLNATETGSLIMEQRGNYF